MRKILVINTGGTITMSASSTGELTASSGDGLSELISSLSADLNIQFEIRALKSEHGDAMTMEDSSAIGPIHWDAMAHMVISSASEFDAYIILHGTDTMAYTASALSFCLLGCDMPVIITGAQVPLSSPGSDGVQNLRLALQTAACSGVTLPAINEVAICFAGQLLRGCRARKTSTRCAIGFQTPNQPSLGDLFPSPLIQAHLLLPPNALEDFSLSPDNLGFSNKVLNINLAPGLSGDILLNLLISSEVEGLVVRVFGSGTAPDTFDLADVVERARVKTNNRFVGAIIVTDVHNGSLELYRYAAGRTLRSPLIIDGRDMTPEAAATKLMWVLGTEKRKQRFNELLNRSLCDEITLASALD